MKPDTHDPPLPIREVAEYLHISKRRAQELAKEHRWRFVGWGRTRRYRQSVIDAWLEGSKVEEPTEQPRATKRGKRQMLPAIGEFVRA